MSTQPHEPDSVSKRVSKHRQNLRKAGFRPVQLWVPDTRSAGFAEECKAQSLKLKDDPVENDTLDWIERGGDDEGWS